MAGLRVTIRPSWRAQWKWVIVFVAAIGVSILLSREVPSTVFRGTLFKIGETRWGVDIPMLWFLPVFALLKPFYNIYNVAYIFFGKGVESRDGILNLYQKVTRIRYEDVRVVEVHQSLWGRILGFGNVEIGTAASQEVEVYLKGVAHPKLIQDVIVSERERVRKEKNEELNIDQSSISSIETV